VTQSYAAKKIKTKTSTRAAGMRRKIRASKATASAMSTKKQRSTIGEIHNISFETCMTRAHWRQLMSGKSNRPKPSPNPATIPNQAQIERSELSDAEFSAMPLCDLATGVFSAPREDEIILSQFSKAKIEVPNRIDL